jgi:hypothetical protein
VRDRGFTLTETIVVVLLVSVLSSVMVAVVAVIWRNTPAAETRVDEARSYQGLVNWLPRDAASTPPDGFVTNGSPTCAGVGATSLVEMTWEFTPNTYVAGYQLVDDGTKHLARYACTSSDPNATLLKVTGELNAASATTSPALPATDVTIELVTCGKNGNKVDCTVPGPVVSVTGASHNPGPTNTLPPPP